MPEKVKKTRFSVTLTEPFVNGIRLLVDRGIYLDPQTMVRELLRNEFEKHGIDPFSGHVSENGSTLSFSL